MIRSQVFRKCVRNLDALFAFDLTPEKLSCFFISRMNALIQSLSFSMRGAVRWMGALLIVVMASLALVTGSQMQVLESSLSRMYENRVVSMKQLQEMEHALTDFAAALTSSGIGPLDTVTRLIRKADGMQQASRVLLETFNKGGIEPELQPARTGYESAFGRWHFEMTRLLEVGREKGQINSALQNELTNSHNRYGTALMGALDTLTNQQLVQAKQDFDRVQSSHKRMTLQFYALMTLTLALILGSLGWLVSVVRNMVGGEPRRLVNVTHEIVLGNLDQKIVVAAGDKSSALANIRVMVDSLRSNQAKNQHRLWIDNGLALINETVRNERSPTQLALEISQKMASYLDVQACALYAYAFGVVDDSMIQRQKLKLLGSESHDSTDFPSELPLPSQFLTQATQDGLVLRNSELPVDCLEALGVSQTDQSRHFLVIPFQFENKVRGIFLVKSRYQLPVHVAELMLPGSAAIGVAFESAQNRETLLASLMDSHRLTNQLQENQEKLQQSQVSIEQQIQYVNGLFSSMQSGLIVVDEQGDIRDCNAALLSMSGLTRKEVIGQRSTILFDDDETTLALFLNSLSKSLTRLEFMEPGSYMNLLNQTPLGCVQIDANGCIQFANSRANQLTGYFGKELIGQPLSVLSPVPLREVYNKLMKGFLEDKNDQKTGYSGQLNMVTKDGEQLTIELGLVNHTVNGQRTVLAFIRNERDLPWSVTITTTLNRLVNDDDESVVTLLKNKKGPSTPVRISSSIMFSVRGIPEQTVINVHDVSSLTHKNEQIKLQNNLLEKTMDAMQDGVLRVDRSGALLSANPKALEIFGYAKVHVLGHTLGALLPAEDSNQLVEHWVPEYHGDVMQRLYDMDPERFWQRLTDMPFPVLGFDATERVKFTNLASQTLLGYAHHSLHGHHLLSILTKDSLDELPQPVSLHSLTTAATEAKVLNWLKSDQNVVAETAQFFTVNIGTEFWVIACLGNSVEEAKAQTMHAVQNVEWVVTQHEGEKIPVVLTAAPLRDAQGMITGAVITMKDMREFKEKEAENLRMVQKMEQSQRLDALGQLAAGVAHDFNNLLGVIQNHAELVEMKIGEESKAAKNLSAILQATTRARDIVIKLNGLGRERPPEEEEENLTLFELSPVIDETKSLLQASLKGIEIAIEPVTPDAAQVQLKGQSGSLQQVLVNLCVNASHAIGERRDGRIVIKASRRSEKTVSVAVIDNGSGIPPETLPRIFEPFFTTKEVGKGTGLGLAMVRSIVTRMGGSIECESQMGVGTSFIVTLPFTS
ncbi:PAS domain [Burkholderiaceae bacterium]